MNRWKERSILKALLPFACKEFLFHHFRNLGFSRRATVVGIPQDQTTRSLLSKGMSSATMLFECKRSPCYKALTVTTRWGVGVVVLTNKCVMCGWPEGR